MTTTSAIDRNGETTLPTAAQIDEVLSDVETLWNKFVPRTSRPVYRGIRDRIDHQIGRVRRYIEAFGEAAGTPDLPTGMEASEDEPPLVQILRLLRELPDEQWEQVVIAQRLRRLSDVDRAELFRAIDAFHCTSCGQECLPEEAHDCPLGDELPEDEADGIAADHDGTLPLVDAPPAPAPTSAAAAPATPADGALAPEGGS